MRAVVDRCGGWFVATGAHELGQLPQMLGPSFNSSRTTISDGTDILRPATLRALGPVLVLVKTTASSISASSTTTAAKPTAPARTRCASARRA